MLSIEDAKNQEDLFQIKAAIMSKKLDDVGGFKGVMEILSLSLESYQQKDYQKSMKIIAPLVEALKEQPFVSNDAVTYVSISNEMEWALYHNFFQVSPRQVKNVNAICPMEYIWRQYGLSALESGDYAKAEEAVSVALKWNPVSANYLLMLAMAHGGANAWDKVLADVVAAMRFMYKPSDLVCGFRFLRDYFIYKKMFKEALYCSILRSRFTSSNEELGDVVDDMIRFTKVVKFDYRKLTDEDIIETCKKYGIDTGFNPEVVAVAQRSYEETFLAGDAVRANYFAQVMSGLKTEQEKRDAVNLRQLFERSRTFVS